MPDTILYLSLPLVERLAQTSGKSPCVSLASTRAVTDQLTDRRIVAEMAGALRKGWRVSNGFRCVRVRVYIAMMVYQWPDEGGER